MKTEIAFVLDRSGSMQVIRDDAIGGFNSFIAEQKKVPGDAAFSLVFFDDKYDVIHDRVPLQDVPALTDKTFVPRGSTALLDAIGKTVAAIQSRTADVDKVILAILTDGQENASREFTQAQIKQTIEQQQAKGWTVLYLGANQDAFAVGSSLGVLRGSTVQYAATAQGVSDAYLQMSCATTRARTAV